MSDLQSKNLKNSLVFTRIEGLPVTKQTEIDCQRLLDGKVTIDALVSEILARRVNSER